MGGIRLQPCFYRRLDEFNHRRLQQGVPVRDQARQPERGHSRVCVRGLPAHVRGYHSCADRRRVRRTHQVFRGALVHGVVADAMLCADRAYGLGRWIPRSDGREGLRGRNRSPYQRRHCSARRLHGPWQADRLWPGSDAAAQPDPDHGRSIPAVGGLVRLQRGQRAGRRRRRGHGSGQYAIRHRRGGARVDVCGVDGARQTHHAGRSLRRGSRPRGDHSGLRFHRPHGFDRAGRRRRHHLLLVMHGSQADVRLR